MIFDVDGTLVDSQADILGAMQVAFDAIARPAPARADVLGIVGLSLPEAFAQLLPDEDTALHASGAEAYKAAYMQRRASAPITVTSPFYTGMDLLLRDLHARPTTLLGVATGKSQRGLDKLIEGHGLGGMFVTRQVADHHPSKPHPSMIRTALSETGVAPDRAVMIGDTSYDMDMARAAGIQSIGVGWGYHGRDRLAGADRFARDVDELRHFLTDYLG